MSKCCVCGEFGMDELLDVYMHPDGSNEPEFYKCHRDCMEHWNDEVIEDKLNRLELEHKTELKTEVVSRRSMDYHPINGKHVAGGSCAVCPDCLECLDERGRCWTEACRYRDEERWAMSEHKCVNCRQPLNPNEHTCTNCQWEQGWSTWYPPKEAYKDHCIECGRLVLVGERRCDICTYKKLYPKRTGF